MRPDERRAGSGAASWPHEITGDAQWQTAASRAGPRIMALDTADPTEDSRTMGSLPAAGFLRLGAAVLGMAGVGALVQAWATRRDERRYPPPGVLVDVGGNRLHLDVRGEVPGRPWCWRPGWARSPPTGTGSRASSHRRSGSWRTTAPDWGGVSEAPPRVTPTRWPSSCIRPCRRPGCPGPTCWPVTRSVGCRSGPSPSGTPARPRAWSWWTPRTRTSGCAGRYGTRTG